MLVEDEDLSKYLTSKEVKWMVSQSSFKGLGLTTFPAVKKKMT